MVGAFEEQNARCYVEGCMVRLKDVLWIVRGLEHPRGYVLALPRYIVKSGTIVKKMKFPFVSELYSLGLAKGFLKYARCYGRLVTLISKREFERAEILHPLFPRECSAESRSIACRVLEELKHESGIETIGLTGSSLLSPPKSGVDVDLVVYGRRESIELYEFLEENRFLKPYSKSELLQVLYSEARFFNKKLLEVEQNKRLQGKRHGVGVYIRLVPKYPEDYSVCTHEILKVGEVAVKGRVVQDDNRFLYPCSYDVEIEKDTIGLELGSIRRLKVVSDRGRFCEIARLNDRVFVRGELELLVSNGRPLFQVYLWKGSHYMLPV